MKKPFLDRPLVKLFSLSVSFFLIVLGIYGLLVPTRMSTFQCMLAFGLGGVYILSSFLENKKS